MMLGRRKRPRTSPLCKRAKNNYRRTAEELLSTKRRDRHGRAKLIEEKTYFRNSHQTEQRCVHRQVNCTGRDHAENPEVFGPEIPVKHASGEQSRTEDFEQIAPRRER